MRDIASGLRGVLGNAMLSVLAASAPLLSGCGDDAIPPGIEDDPGFVPVDCGADSVGQQRWLAGLNPAIATEYTELRFAGFGGQSDAIETLGTLCGGAPDAAACRSEFQALSREQGFEFGTCGDLCLSAQIAATQGQAVVLSDSRPELISFLGAIDTPGEAMLLVQASRLEVACDRGGAKPEGEGFAVQAFSYRGCDGRTRHLQHVDAAGNVISVDSVVEKKPDPNCQVGRRPLGLLPARDCPGGSAVGRYWADAAHLEAASIAAFRRLRCELRLHGAPRRLLDAARRAARDEVRHARTVGKLARAFGAAPEAVRIEPLPLRDLEAIAVENAAEGCVRETYGALVALWQARFASDAKVRAVYARIAEDESRHAALAWRVAAWSERRLSAGARARVRKARQAAVEELLRELEVEPHREVGNVAGVPASVRAIALAKQLERSIWS